MTTKSWDFHPHRQIPDDMYASQPVLWYRLIRDVEAFRLTTGWGLAGTWGFVHRGEYDLARRSFDGVLEMWGDNYPPGDPDV